MRGSSSDVLKCCPAFFATSLMNFASPLPGQAPGSVSRGSKSYVVFIIRYVCIHLFN